MVESSSATSNSARPQESPNEKNKDNPYLGDLGFGNDSDEEQKEPLRDKAGG